MSTDAGEYSPYRSGEGGERRAPRPTRRPTLAAAVAAETGLGFRLVARHRTPRLALALGLAMVAVVAFRDSPARAGPEVALLASGTVSAIAGSRLLASGPALTSVRRIAPPVLVMAIGRLAGAFALTVPVAWLAAWCVGVAQGPAYVAEVGLVTSAHALATAAVVMAAAPLMGTSGGALFGLIMVWAGGIRPSTVDSLLGAWPYVRAPAVFLWNSLPLSWRAHIWLEGAGVHHAVLLLVWTAAGVAVATWTAGLITEGRPEG